MAHTLIPPSSLDENGLERLVIQMSALPRDSGSLNIDLGHIVFIDSYGMLGLLELGRHFSQRGHKLLLHLPLSMEVQRRLDRMDFFRYLSESYLMYPPYRPFAARAGRVEPSDALLEITRIEKPEDTHKMMEKIKERAGPILEAHLHYKDEAVQGFLAAVHQICQNIIQHSQNTGLVGIEKCFNANLNINIVKIAAMDLGIGFKESLSSRLGSRYGGQWSDIAALEEAVLHGASGRQKAGRGHGLAAVKEFAKRWGAKLSIRSGTARLSLLVDRENSNERETGLPDFPGVRVSLVLSEV
jgi:hypothetical protein